MEIRTDLERLRRDISTSRVLSEVGVPAYDHRDYRPPAPPPQPPPQPIEEPARRRRGVKKIFFLGFIPGLGALYNRQYTKAAIHVGIFILLSTLSDVIPRAFRDTFGWVRVAFFFYMAFDAYHTAQKRLGEKN